MAREILEICRITKWCNIRFVSKAVLAFFFYRFWQIKRIEMHFVFEFICWKACDISMHNINKMEKIVTRIITKVEFYLNKIFLGRSSKLSYKALRMSIIIRLFHWNLLILGFPFYQMVKQMYWSEHQTFFIWWLNDNIVFVWSRKLCQQDKGLC